MNDRPKAPIKVLHLISTLDMGGAEQNLLRLASTLDKTRFSSHVVCMTTPGIVGESLKGCAIPVHSLAMEKGTPDLKGVYSLLYYARLIKPDVIQCWMYHANLLGLSMAQPGRTLWNIRCSSMDLDSYGRVYRYSVKAGAVLSSAPYAVVANSYSGRDVHEELGYHPRRWIVIPNGFDPDMFRPDPTARKSMRESLKIPPDSLVIGLVGRFDPMKDHGNFFQAAQALLEIHPQTRFVLAGRGITWENTALVELMPEGLDRSRVQLLGERTDVSAVFSSLDVLSSSSWGEGFPNAVGEAMACGVPCVVTDAGDSRVLVGDTGIVVSRKSPVELCSAWDTMARMSPEKRSEMGARARDRIVRNYTQDRTTRSYEELYRQVVRT